MVFILGIERSATTWVSNILDSHPQTNVLVEPMSFFTSRFKEWPDRFTKIEDLYGKAEYFKDEIEVLKRRKRWLCTRFSESKISWQIDLNLAGFLVRKKLAPDFVQDFLEVNFHRKGQGFREKKNVKLEVIKELRFNYNAALIKYIAPDAKVVVVLRNMAANVQSILKHLEQGNLIELRKLLLEYYGEINEQSIFKYWSESYSTLLQDLEATGIPYYVLGHTQLITKTEQTVSSMFDFMGLENTDSVLKYIEKSNTSGKGIHNTNRDHETLLSRNKQAYEEVTPVLDDNLKTVTLHPKLYEYIGR